jgi:hypothetical protein
VSRRGELAAAVLLAGPIIGGKPTERARADLLDAAARMRSAAREEIAVGG